MDRCFEHDYEAVFCRNCGGYCGMACTNCGDMTDGGEHTYVTMEWCHCDNQVFTFNYEEPDEGGRDDYHHSQYMEENHE